MSPEMKTPTLSKEKKTNTKPNNANPMRKPYVQKLVVNIGVGEGGEKLQKATKVLEMLTKQKSVKTISKTTNRDWGMQKNSLKEHFG
jgi:ribosomal protein L5